MSNREVQLSFKGERQANAYRQYIGLAKIKSAWKRCLNCEKRFYSLDICNNRLCVTCSKREG